MNCRLLAIDLDGCLLDDQWQVGPRSLKAIQTASGQDVTIVLASGRMPLAIRPTLARLQVPERLVAYNGAWVLNGEATIDEQPINGTDARELLSFAWRLDLRTLFFVRDSLFAEQPDHVVDFYTKRTGASSELCNPEELVDSQLLKVIMYDPDDPSPPGQPSAREDEIYEQAKMLGQGEVHGFRTKYGYVEFVSARASKYSGLQSLAKHLKIDLSEVAAVGDGQNDVEMLRNVGCGVALANAVPEAKEAADIVVTHTNNTDGVSEAIERILA